MTDQTQVVAVAPIKVELKVCRPGAIIPKYQSAEAAGMDIHACITEPIFLNPGETKLIPTGIAVSIRDPNVALHFLPRSGLSIKQGIVLGNLVGLIDSDYQGELMVAAWNRKTTGGVVEIKPGDRIAQMVFMPILRAEFTEVEEFTVATERAHAGFGSTGIAAVA